MEIEEQKDCDEKLDDLEFSIDSSPNNVPKDQETIYKFKQNK